VSDTRESLRARRDACVAHFAVAMLVCIGMTAAWAGDGGMTYVRMAAAITFVASMAYGGVAWACAAWAHWRLKLSR
jgi:hypothetical protein